MKAQGIDGDSGEPRCQELRLPVKERAAVGLRTFSYSQRRGTACPLNQKLLRGQLQIGSIIQHLGKPGTRLHPGAPELCPLPGNASQSRGRAEQILSLSF